MHWVQALIVFSISWWLVFLPSLSVGIQGQHEGDGEIVEGTEAGAPVAPMLLKKAKWATIGAVVITGVAALVLPRVMAAMAVI
ncbi:MAG: DUF1467 family protein [Pseudomonadota bacterium]